MMLAFACRDGRLLGNVMAENKRLEIFAWEEIGYANLEPPVIQIHKPKIIAFDVFGTVFDFSNVPYEERKAYADHIQQPEWSPLTLPASWENLPPHPDSQLGIEFLREQFIVVTCSNGPLGLLTKLSKNAGISWDAIIPLELNKVFKPNDRAYLTVCEVFGVEPRDVMMVTANKDFGDIEAAQRLGMQWSLIRNPPDGAQTIIELAGRLGIPYRSMTDMKVIIPATTLTVTRPHPEFEAQRFLTKLNQAIVERLLSAKDVTVIKLNPLIEIDRNPYPFALQGASPNDPIERPIPVTHDPAVPFYPGFVVE